MQNRHDTHEAGQRAGKARGAGGPLRTPLRCLAVLIGANILYLVFMMACYCIPTQGAIKVNVGNSLYTWQKEDVSPIFDDTKAYWADFRSDLIWVNMAVTREGTAFEDAVRLPWKQNDADGEDKRMQFLIQALYYPDDGATTTADYSRYWMLTVGLLKILFNFMEIRQIRYLYWMFAASLMLLVLYCTDRQCGGRAAAALFIAMLMRNWLLHTASISTGADILVTLEGMLAVLLIHRYREEKRERLIPIAFVLTGSLDFAFGPLVAPVMSLTMTLILELLLEREKGKNLWRHVILLSIGWAAGYVGTMAFKSALSLIVEGKQTTSSTVLYYLGPGQGILPRLSRIVYCLHGLMEPLRVKIPFVLCVALVLIVLAVRRGTRRFEKLYPVLFVSMYPVVWSFVVVEHSKHYFSANNYSGFVFGLLCATLYSIGDGRATRSVGRLGRDPGAEVKEGKDGTVTEA